MIQKNTILHVIDNSGAQRAKCIHVYKGYRRRYANVGDLVLVSLLAVKKKLKLIHEKKQKKQDLLKGSICKAVVVRTKSGKFFKNARRIHFKQNAIVLIGNKNKYHGTRVFGAIPHSLRSTKFLRLTSMAGNVVK